MSALLPRTGRERPVHIEGAMWLPNYADATVREKVDEAAEALRVAAAACEQVVEDFCAPNEGNTVAVLWRERMHGLMHAARQIEPLRHSR